MHTIDKIVEVKNVSLYVRLALQYPNRPVIVFLHDSLGCVELWRDFPERLCTAVSCNMLVYDRQGYGKSAPLAHHHRTNAYLENEAIVLHDLLTLLDIKDVIIFGHSDGGSIALIAAGQYPSLFKAVIVEAAHIFVEDITLDGIRKAVDAYQTTDLKTKLEKYHGDKTETLFKAWTETWLSERFRSWNILKFLLETTSPVIFIQGEHDEYGTVAQMKGVKENVRAKVELCLLPDVHHTPHKQAAENVIERVSKFLHRVFLIYALLLMSI
jgi:pimeloyl-ACP methyl ester carboxylesterase